MTWTKVLQRRERRIYKGGGTVLECIPCSLSGESFGDELSPFRRETIPDASWALNRLPLSAFDGTPAEFVWSTSFNNRAWNRARHSEIIPAAEGVDVFAGTESPF
jgi:hypothetical protein